MLMSYNKLFVYFQKRFLKITAFGIMVTMVTQMYLHQKAGNSINNNINNNINSINNINNNNNNINNINNNINNNDINNNTCIRKPYTKPLMNCINWEVDGENEAYENEGMRLVETYNWGCKRMRCGR